MTNRTSDNLTQREQARRLLIDLMRDRHRILIDEAMQAAEEAEISYSTLRRARRDLGLVTRRNGPLPAFWETPEGAKEGPASPQTTGAETEEMTLDDRTS